ncbi:MAG TPA: PadR family transcriptional regulator [Streptosporangiaceae bacterium]|nr:PadR family transcriptional regulator [Streptosporangiaceae bacterium]
MKRPVSNVLALAVLGLLLERPMHPYEMATTLRARSKDASFKVTTGSLYDVIEALTREGWIAPQGMERAGKRPERTIYAQTDRGATEFVTWLDELIRQPTKEFPRFLAAVSYLGALGPDRAAQALEERITKLSDQVDEAQETLGQAYEQGVPRLFMIEMEYAITMTRAELDWARQTVTEIRDGALAWPSQEDISGISK